MPIRTDPAPRAIPVAPGQGSVPSAELAPAREMTVPSPVHTPVRPMPTRPDLTAARPAPRRPDPTSARLAVAAGGIATISALLAAIGSAAVPGAVAAAPTIAPAAPLPVQTIVKYVYVQPGAAAPVAPPAAVATVVATPAPRPAPVVVVTRQSGAKP